jgi:hypothetical protein
MQDGLRPDPVRALDDARNDPLATVGDDNIGPEALQDGVDQLKKGLPFRLVWVSERAGRARHEAVIMHAAHFRMVESAGETESRSTPELEGEFFEPHRIFNAARPVIKQRSGENRTVRTALGNEVDPKNWTVE